MLEISRLKLDALESALEKFAYDEPVIIHIYEDMDLARKMPRNKRKNAPLVWGVNWGACGTQSVNDTLEYCDRLRYAAEIAKALNDLELKRPGWDDDNTDNETYRREAYNIYDILATGKASAENIREWIEKEV